MFIFVTCCHPASSKMELKRKLIQDQQDQIQMLKSLVNETREEKLRLSSDVQKRQQLEEQSVEFTAELQTLTRDIRVGGGKEGGPTLKQNFILCSFPLPQGAKEQLSPLSTALEKLQQEKQELADRKRQKREEGQEKVETMWTCHDGIHLKMQENCQGNNPNPNYPSNPKYLT